jgi:hypothetical protein
MATHREAEGLQHVLPAVVLGIGELRLERLRHLHTMTAKSTVSSCRAEGLDMVAGAGARHARSPAAVASTMQARTLLPSAPPPNLFGYLP